MYPSLVDSLPTSIIEGMSLAKPAVVTSVGGIPEMITNDVTGFIVPPGRPELMANVLFHLLENPAARTRIGQAAKSHYLTHYQPEIMARALETLFDNLTSESRRPA